jgi:alanyl-tRNA synthetase
MTSNEIRERFLSYFERKGHARVASSPVIPWGDPTLMFTNAGMNQFKDLFLGREKRDYVRATTCQKCIRAGGKHNDLDEVGRTTRHGTFLEMLGNFSFGDYFKRDAIAFAWEFMTGEMALDPAILYPSIYSTDEEAFAIWRDEMGVPEKHILRFGNIEKGDEENFWSMGPTGPCGPCSELYIDRGSEWGPDDPYEALARNTSRFLELWNLVFMQYNRDEAGNLEPLPKPSIDTGMGLERIAMVKQDKNNIFETDILGSLVKRVEELTGRTYDEKHGMPFRVAADHVRTLTFAIADGAIPSNEGRGYVLRRILRRASRYLRQLDAHEPLLYKLVGDTIELMRPGYPDLSERAEYISMVIKSEEERFLRTLDQGIDLFDGLAQTVLKKGGRVIAGVDAFRLYDTYGFPVDLTRIMAEEQGMTVDMAGFEREMDAQRERAREASNFSASQDSGGPWTEMGGDGVTTVFVGYDTDTAAASLIRWRAGTNGVFELVFDHTPFYAQSGGQVNDTGFIKSADHSLVLTVEEVAEIPGAGRVHRCRVADGVFDATKLVTGAFLEIDYIRRRDTERNHSATHLLQAALRQVLGDHVRQSGSYVDSERLRFDFNHFAGMKPDEIARVEERVTMSVMQAAHVEIHFMSLDEARSLGAMSLFDEKYGEVVRMVKMGDISKELCGGTHVSNTGKIGPFRIVSESSVAAGIRRIEAVTGIRAYEMARADRNYVKAVSESLKTPHDAGQAIAQIERLQTAVRECQTEIKRLKTEGPASGGLDFLADALDIAGVKVAAGRVPVGNAGELKDLADTVRAKLGSGVGVLGAEIEGKVSVVVTVTDDVIEKYGIKAGDLVKDIAGIVGGSGGGRPHMAQAGGKDPSKLDEALSRVPEIVRAKLKG